MVRGAETGSRYEPELDDADAAWIAALPKAELHLHLGGSVRPATALRLARERHLFDELDDVALVASLRAPDRCSGQAELLEAFRIPVATMQDAEALQVVAAELVEDIASDGTTYAEIRFSPASHARGGLSLAGVIGAVAAGVRAGRAALAARESAVSPPEVRLIAVAMRADPPERTAEVARVAAEARTDGLTGFDVAGPEAATPSIAPHLGAYRIARDAGLGLSVHAGEWGGPAQVWDALTADPQRIAHGGPAAWDERLIAELVARDVTLDLCPTSNVQANLVPSMAEHPLPRLLRAGVSVTISTDDRTVSATTLTRELGLAIDPLGLGRDDLLAMTRRALRVAYLQDDEWVRTRLLATLDEVR